MKDPVVTPPRSQPQGFLSSREAAAYLDVKPATLYTYVSRGWLRSVPSPTSRCRWYDSTDLKRLRIRRDARAGHGAVAASALQIGPAVMDSALTVIATDGPRYRGCSAIHLAKSGASFESVAELLWTGDLPKERPRWPAAPSLEDHEWLSALLARAAHEEIVNPSGSTLFQGIALWLNLWALDAKRRGADELDTLRDDFTEARRLLMLMATLPSLNGGLERLDQALGALTVASRVSVAWGGELSLNALDRRSRALDQALVLCADHELDTSTFAARVTASAGGNLLSCIISALVTLYGARHGGVCVWLEEVLSDILDPSDARAFVAERVSSGLPTPGFNHPLYPNGDPRPTPLLAIARAAAPSDRRVRALFALIQAMDAAGQGAPTLELGLVALTAALHLPRGAASMILAVGRTAGFIAHIREEWMRGALIRPRARYVGP